LDFKVVQSREYRYPEKLVTSACYDKQQTCMSLSATVFTLNEPTAVE